jgi:ribosomal subunit interface protein
MQLSVSGKHLDVGDSLRAHVATIIAASAERYFGRAIEGKVLFQRARHAYRADISVHVTRGLVVQSHGEATDPYAAFDAAAERLDKRLQRHKHRLVDRRREAGRDQDAGAAEATPHFILGPDEATSAAAAQNGEDHDQGRPAIVAEISVDIEQLTVGDAVMRLDLGDLPVLLFRSRIHGGYNVVYRRADGTIGWIDPPVTAGAGVSKGQ